MLYNSKKLLTLLFLICSIQGVSQNHLFDIQKFTEEDGLPSRFVYDVIEDHGGYTWLATQDGIVRFDGHEFRIFNTNNSPLLINDCRVFIDDFQGNIWIGNSPVSGFYLDWNSYINSEGKICKNDSLFITAELNDYKIQSRISIIDSTLIFANGDGELTIKKNETVQKVLSDEKYNRSLPLQMDPLILATYKKAYFFDKNYKELKVEEAPEQTMYGVLVNEQLYWHNYTTPKSELVNFSLQKSTGGQTKLIKNDDPNLHSVGQGDQSVSISNWNKGKAVIPYVSGFNTLILFDSTRNIIQDYGQLIAEEYGPNQISSYYKKRNKLWIPTENGLFLITEKKNLFTTHLNTSSENISTRGFLKNQKGQIIVSTHKGIFELDPTKNNFTLSALDKFDFPVFGMVECNDKSILIGGAEGRCYSFDNSKNKLEELLLEKSTSKNNPISGHVIPFVSNEGKKYFGTTHGILEVKQYQNTNILKEIKYDIDKNTNSQISHFKEFDDEIWVSASNGLFVINLKTNTINQHYLSEYRIEHFHREGNFFWCATYGEGLIRWNKETGNVKKFGKDQGLINEKLMAVYGDTQDRLWVTSNNGLACFDKKSESFRMFRTADGISHKEFNFNSHFQDSDGRLFFGGLDGITSFDPSDFYLEDVITHPIALTSFNLVSKETGALQDITNDHLDSKHTIIDSEKNYFELKFNLLNFQKSNEITYATLIEGFNKNWTYQKNNLLRVTQLPYGDYTIKIKARDQEGIWSSNELNIPISIEVPFYKKSKFQLLGIALLIGLLYLVFRWRLKRSEYQKKELQLIVNNRTKELSSINETKDRLFAILAHDLRNPVVAFESLTESLNYLIATGQESRVQELGDFIEKEAKQLHHLLDNLLNWSLSQRNELNISNIPNKLNVIVDSALQNYITLKDRIGINIDKDIPEDLVVYADHRIIETVFRNVLSNSFKYCSKNDTISIIATREVDHVKIEFKDTGTGMTENELKNLFDIIPKNKSKGNTASVSLGMHLCKELIELSNGNISASSNLNSGTIITIKLPYSHHNTV